jgi:hypothetical protein
MKPEIIYDMPEEAYHQSTGLGSDLWITRSMLKTYIADKPLFKLRYIDKLPYAQVKQSKAMALGVYIEDALLNGTGDKWTTTPALCWSKNKGELVRWNMQAGQFVIDDEGKPTGQTTKQWAEEHPNIVTLEDSERVSFIRERFNETAMGRYWLNNVQKSIKQPTIRWQDAATGLRLQVRLDCLLEDHYISDLKTSSRSIDKFSDVADEYGYHHQHSLYQDAYEFATGKRLPFFFNVVETSGLERCRCVQLHPVQIAHAKKELRSAMDGIASGDYSATDATTQGPMAIQELPAWLHYKYESEN